MSTIALTSAVPLSPARATRSHHGCSTPYCIRGRPRSSHTRTCPRSTHSSFQSALATTSCSAATSTPCAVVDSPQALYTIAVADPCRSLQHEDEEAASPLCATPLRQILRHCALAAPHCKHPIQVLTLHSLCTWQQHSSTISTLLCSTLL